MPDIPQGLVPARYKGIGTGLREGVKYFNADGTPKEDLSLEPGDEMLWQDEDVYGKTLWNDPNQNIRSQYIGLWKVVKPEHAGKSDAELQAIGYEWHMPRPDLTPINPLEEILAQRKAQEPQEISQTVTIEQPSEDVPDEDETVQVPIVDASQAESEQS